VIEVLAQLVSVHGAPQYLRSDNGPEFVATAILKWLQTAHIETAFIDPGKPWQNGTDESFNGKFRNEYSSLQWFRNRLDAKVGIEQWRRHYNDIRPHMNLGDLTPAEFKATLCGPFSRRGARRLRRLTPDLHGGKTRTETGSRITLNWRHSLVIRGPKKAGTSPVRCDGPCEDAD
jgi:putative transposase